MNPTKTNPNLTQINTSFASAVQPRKKQTKVWITDSSAYSKTRLTVLKTTRSLLQVRADVLFLMTVASDLRDEADKAQDHMYNETEPLETSTCVLLIKYFGYELSADPSDAIEVDMLDLWQGPESRKPDIYRKGKWFQKWLYLSRFRVGLLPQLERLFREDDLGFHDGFPWHQDYTAAIICKIKGLLYKVKYGYFNDVESANKWIQGVSCIEESSDSHRVGRIRFIDAEGFPSWGSFLTKEVKVAELPAPGEGPLFRRADPFDWPETVTEFWATRVEVIQEGPPIG